MQVDFCVCVNNFYHIFSVARVFVFNYFSALRFHLVKSECSVGNPYVQKVFAILVNDKRFFIFISTSLLYRLLILTGIELRHFSKRILLKYINVRLFLLTCFCLTVHH